jgi:hypothetical protein
LPTTVGLSAVLAFIMSSPDMKPNRNTVAEVMQNADSNSSAGAAADSEQKVEDTSVSQHSRKPPVVGSQSHGTEIESVQLNKDVQKIFHLAKFSEESEPILKAYNELFKKYGLTEKNMVLPIRNGELVPFIDVQSYNLSD